MAIHSSHKSMIKESLIESLEVAEFCINYRKDPKKWGTNGCYGYPANVLLLAITDAIGSYVLQGSTRNHFNILNHSDYYDLNLDNNSVAKIYKSYRCLGTHKAVLGADVILSIGEDTDVVFSIIEGSYLLRLKPFFNLTKKVVLKFLEDDADSLVPDVVSQ